MQGEDLLWNDYEVKLLDQAVRTMESYVSQFPDVRVRQTSMQANISQYADRQRAWEQMHKTKLRQTCTIIHLHIHREYVWLCFAPL